MGRWTFKDTLAHIMEWAQYDIRKLEGSLRGDEPIQPGGLNDADTDTVNQWIYEHHKDRPLQEILTDFRGIWERMEEALLWVSEEDLTEPGKFEWMDGQPLGQGVLDDFFGHIHDEHEPGIRAWLE
jgi:hypothetical protein